MVYVEKFRANLVVYHFSKALSYKKLTLAKQIRFDIQKNPSDKLSPIYCQCSLKDVIELILDGLLDYIESE